MEHSLLHGLQLCGIIFALGSCLFQLLILSRVGCATRIQNWLGRLAARAAFLSAIAAGIDLLVQIAELEERTVYSAFHAETLWLYVTGTTVGRLALAKTCLLAISGIFLRSSLRAKWACSAALLLSAAFVTSLVSHAAALPVARALPVFVQFLHIVAGAFWLGMLANLFILTRNAHRGGEPEMIRLVSKAANRFSPFALAAAILLAVSGVYSTIRLIANPTSLLVSAYGLTLFLKLGLLAVVLYPAFQNWRVICPRLASAGDADARRLLNRFVRFMELELTAGILVIVVAGILASISPPGPNGDARLNRRQIDALVTAALPPVQVTNPKAFVGAPERTAADLRYSEFTHRWAGVFVLLLGFFWLGQSAKGSNHRFYARAWPWLLVPFGIFIAVAADPEIWILGTLSFGQVLRNPQLIEHQLGALLVFLLVILGLRDSRRQNSQHERPLGFALPVLLVAGSLMLLGHAHSTLGASDQLSTLINVEHAIFGALGLAAGLIRWLQLRALVPPSARLTWSLCVIVLGGFMTFFYKELY